MKGIFDARPDSGYDDDIQSRYHFPARYLLEAEKMVGDWVVYRATRRGGSRPGYFATAQVTGIDADPARARHSYAWVTNYLRFDDLVPLRSSQGFYERELNTAPLVGARLRGNSVRIISDLEFGDIVRAGLRETLSPTNRVKLELDDAHVDSDTKVLLDAPEEEQERLVVQILVNRKIRDANFRRQVCEAYENTCAVTRLSLINGGGKPEVQAAHIWPVAENGPDVIQNGIALSSTVHWLFDRHLISLTDDYRLLVAHNRVPSELQRLFEGQLQRIHLPADRKLWPHPAYVQRHRAAYVG